MSDHFVRHLISFVVTLVSFLIFWVGYMSGTYRWGWAAISVLVMYVIIYKLLDI